MYPITAYEIAPGLAAGLCSTRDLPSRAEESVCNRLIWSLSTWTPMPAGQKIALGPVASIWNLARAGITARGLGHPMRQARTFSDASARLYPAAAQSPVRRGGRWTMERKGAQTVLTIRRLPASRPAVMMTGWKSRFPSPAFPLSDPGARYTKQSIAVPKARMMPRFPDSRTRIPTP